MQKYLFLILDRYEASFSESHQVRSPLDAKVVFRNCMIKFAGFGSDEAEVTLSLPKGIELTISKDELNDFIESWKENFED